MLQEFKIFIAKGNVLDLAVGVVIGAAFGKITTSLVEDIINPVLGLLIGGVDFTELKIVLKEAVGETPEVAIKYGNFIQVLIQFVIIAWVIFLIVKLANRLRLTEAPPKA
jgi:large conductance mechanosensitive channel